MKKLMVAFVFATLVLAGCAATRPAAFTVNGKSFTEERIFDEIKAAERAQPEAALGVLGLAPDSFAMSAVDAAINNIIYLDVLLEEAADSLGVTVTDADISAFKSRVPPGQLDALDPADVDRLVRLAVLQQAIAATLTDQNVDEAALRAQYDANPGRFSLYCMSIILAGDTAAADQAIARLRAGEPFATVLRETTTDQSLLAQNGSVGCNAADAFDQSVPGLSGIVSGLGAGGIGGPISLPGGGAVVIVVDRVEPQSFEAVRDQLALEAGFDPTQLLNDLLTSLADAATVTVNPRFGTWVSDGEAPPRVEPPDAPLENGEELTERAPEVGGFGQGGLQLPGAPPPQP